MTFEERWTDLFTRLKNDERVPQDTTEPTPAEIAGCRSKPFMQTPYRTYNERFTAMLDVAEDHGEIDIKALVDAFAVTSLNTLRHVFTKLISLTEMLTQIPSAGIEETEDLDQTGFNVAHVIWESIPKEQREKSQLETPVSGADRRLSEPAYKAGQAGDRHNAERRARRTRGGNAVRVWHPF